MKSACIVVSCILLLMGSAEAFQAKKKAPPFSLKTSEGTTVELKKLKGKLVLVNFWATWCGPCRAEIPAFVDLYERYKDKGLEIVGISVDDNGWSDVKPFVEKYKINYPVVIDQGAVVRAYGNFNAIPVTFIVDKEGNLVDRHVGLMKKEVLQSLIKSYL